MTKIDTIGGNCQHSKERIKLGVSLQIAGSKEALTDRSKPKRRLFQISIFLFLICSIYFSSLIFIDWLKNEYIDEMTEFIDANITMSNITVCPNAFLNETYIKSSLKIPETLKNKLLRIRMNESEFLSLFSKYIIVTPRLREFEDGLSTYFRRLYEFNMDLMGDFMQFYLKASPSCPDTLKNCTFNGQPFNCCDRAVPTLTDGSVCYQLMMDFDLEQLPDRPSSLRQSKPGPQGGLSLEVIGDLTDTPWLENDRKTGFEIYVQPLPVSEAGSPVAATGETHTYVKIVPRKRILTRKCIPDGTVAQLPWSRLGAYDDPYGYECVGQRYNKMMYELARCHFPVSNYLPNASFCCSPQSLFFFTRMLSKGVGAFTDNTSAPLQKLLELMERSAIDIFHDKICKPRCIHWLYDVTTSYHSLERPISVISNGTDNNEDQSTYSRVTIYYARLEYMQRTETKKLNTYLAFCNFGNIIGLYLGLSIAGIVNVLIHGIPYGVRSMHRWNVVR